MSDASFDCYLCGASNGPDADFCVKCDGQLLKLPEVEEEFEDGPNDEEVFGDQLDSTTTGTTASGELGNAASSEPLSPASSELESTAREELGNSADDESTNESDETADPAQKKKKKKRFTRSLSTSVQDQRLSDALGLSEDEEELDYLDVEVTSIPTARAAENIPIIGTRADTAVQPSGDQEIGKVAFVIVGMLIIATAWFGYDSLIRERSVPGPDSIGFVDTTTTTPTVTTTTAAPDLSWSIDEVDLRFSPTIVRVIPYACSGTSGDPVSEPWIGIALDAQTVVLSGNTPADANAVRIVTRTGSARTGIISRQDGVVLAASNVRTLRNLSIVETADEAAFFVGYDFDANSVATTDSPQEVDAEISVSAFGEVHEVRIDDSTISAETLANIDLVVEFDAEETSGNSTCGEAAGISLPDIDTPLDEQAAEEE